MIEANKIVANFQMIASRLVKFELETKEVNNGKEKVNVKNNFDYEVIKDRRKKLKEEVKQSKEVYKNKR